MRPEAGKKAGWRKKCLLSKGSVKIGNRSLKEEELEWRVDEPGGEHGWTKADAAGFWKVDDRRWSTVTVPSAHCDRV